MYTLTREQLILIRDILSEQDSDTTQIVVVLNDCLIDRVGQIEIIN